MSGPAGDASAAAANPALIDRDIFCRGCGLNVRGLPVEASCPDCGARIRPEGASGRLSGTVGWDLACARCSYNLKGLDRSNACPECGLPVADTLRPQSLRKAPPEMLRRMSMWLFVDFACMLALGGVMLVGVFGWSSMFRPQPSVGLGPMMMVTTLVRWVAMLGSFTAWLMLARELRLRRVMLRELPSSVNVVRIGAGLGISGALVGLVTQGLMLGSVARPIAPGTSSIAFMLMGLLSFVLGLLLLVGFPMKHFGSLAVVRWLATNAGDAKTVQRARVLTYASIAAVVAVPASWVLFLVLAFGAMGGGGSGSGWTMGAIFITLGLGVIVLFVMYVFLMLRARGMLLRLAMEPVVAPESEMPGADAAGPAADE